MPPNFKNKLNHKPSSNTVEAKLLAQLSEAIFHHQQGRLKEAQVIYEAILKINPKHFDALHLLGLINLNENKYQIAADLIAKAIVIYPQNPAFHSNRGIALKELNQLNAALASYDKAIRLKPDFAEAYYNRGVVLQELKQLDAALLSYNQAINLKPDYVDAYCNRGNTLQELKQWDAAVASYDKAISLNPAYADAYYNRGVVLQELNEYARAINDYCIAIDLDNSKKRYWINFAICLSKIEFTACSEKLLQHSVSLLSQGTITRPATVLQSLLKLLDHHQAVRAFLGMTVSADRAMEVGKIIEELNAIPLLTSLLKLTPITHAQYERSFTAVRKLILENLFALHEARLNETEGIFKFLLTLAHQCFINEYVYFQTEEESALVAELEKNIAAEIEASSLKDAQRLIIKIITLATYEPLHTYAWAQSLNAMSGLSDSEDYKSLLKLQILEPQEERQIRSSIQTLNSIENNVSKAVQAQYEINPYPRWVATQIADAPIKIHTLFDQINLKRESLDAVKTNAPDILIAGCGTGQQSIDTASRFENAKVTAIDLSLSSLSYAIRKTKALGIANIDYLQADILDLKAMNKQFDIVESVGVLHHMSDPLAGWRSLIDCTKDNGLMKIGLYSEIARRDVVAVREFIEKKNLSGTPSEIRALRNEIFNAAHGDLFEAKKLERINDLYTMSECRDLLFHVQEHRFNLLQIDEILKNFGLRFLGFEFVENSTKTLFRQQMPNGSEYSLSDWHQFEIANPRTFLGMYQFWLQK